MQCNKIDQNKEHGFVKLWRSIREWEWYTIPETSHLFLHLILSANWETKQWRGYTIRRGQYMTSNEKLSIQTGLTISQVRTSLDRLKKSKDILTKTTNKNTLVTIIKYEYYQENDKKDDNQIANNKQSNDNQIATTKETKEIKEVKERESTLAFSFLKSKHKKRFDAWEKKYKEQIRVYDKFILDYNDMVIIEAIPFEADELFNFLCLYANGFIKYGPLYDTSNQPRGKRKGTLSNFEFLKKDCSKEIENIKSRYKMSQTEWSLCIGKFNEKNNKGLNIETFKRFVNNWKNNLKSYDDPQEHRRDYNTREF